MADRNGQSGTLVVNNGEPVNELFRGGYHVRNGHRTDRIGTTKSKGTIGLNLERDLYLGGVDPSETINVDVGLEDGFVGCIGELIIGGETIKLIEEAKMSMNIQDCGDRSLCERRPCRNGATCVDVSPTQYYCNCDTSFT